jgi:hypothetical protein
MNLTEYTNLLKTDNAKYKVLGNPTQLLQQLALSNTFSQRLTWLGANPALFDYPAGTSMGTSITGNSPSTAIQIPQDYVKNPILIRLTTTVGATPTASFLVEGSHDNSTWFTLLAADSATPDTFVTTPFVVTTATTLQKVVKPGQRCRYIRFNITANTNVTVTTADLTYL